jgi:hypothetical protein
MKHKWRAEFVGVDSRYNRQSRIVTELTSWTEIRMVRARIMKCVLRPFDASVVLHMRVPYVPAPAMHHPLATRDCHRTLSARFIADMQTHWEKHGMSALDEVRRKFPDRYVDNYVILARVIRLAAGVNLMIFAALAHCRNGPNGVAAASKPLSAGMQALQDARIGYSASY